MGSIAWVKTTLELSDDLLQRAKRQARQRGRTLRSLVEEGLRLALQTAETRPPQFSLPDCSVGSSGDENPLEGLSWADLRAEIYGGR